MNDAPVSFLAAVLAFWLAGGAYAEEAPSESLDRFGIAVYGAPALAPGFKRLPYVNPNAPKSGRLTKGYLGSFDALNSLAVVGNTPYVITPYVVQSLTYRSLDEPFTVYPLLAEKIRMPENRTFIEFTLNKKARFSDGRPVRADDVIFSWDLLRKHGHPYRRSYYGKVKKAQKIDDLTVRFTLGRDAKWDTAPILALLPVMAKHATDPEKFLKMGFTPLLGSGPYLVRRVKPGQSILLSRDPNFWGKDLPVLKGLYNFDELSFEYFRDANTLKEAFQSGLIDLRIVSDPLEWDETSQAFSSEKKREIAREAYDFAIPSPMNGFVFNTRRFLFKDKAVREALTMLFDFPWVNEAFFRGYYKRSLSYFGDSELSSHGRPISAQEKMIFGPKIVMALPEAIKQGVWAPLASDGSGRDRRVMRRAFDLLIRAGYRLHEGALIHAATKRPLKFTITVRNTAQERLALAFSDFLKYVGVEAQVQNVDQSRYWSLVRRFAFDMILWDYQSSSSPGSEQENRWSSAAADRLGSLNYAGARSTAVDRALNALLKAQKKKPYVEAARALDRALLAGNYMVPLHYSPGTWLLRWRRIGRPDRLPRYALETDAWWDETARKKRHSPEEAPNTQ